MWIGIKSERGDWDRGGERRGCVAQRENMMHYKPLSVLSRDAYSVRSISHSGLIDFSYVFKNFERFFVNIGRNNGNDL